MFWSSKPTVFFRGKIASKCRNFPNFPENDPCLRVWVHILRKFKSLNFCPFFRICPTTSRDWLGNATKRPLERKKTSRKCRTFFAFLFRNFGKNAPELGNSLLPSPRARTNISNIAHTMALYLQPNYVMGRVGCLLAPQAHGTLLLPGSLLAGFYELCPNGHSGSQENVKVKTLNRVSPVDYPATRSEIKGFC